MARLTYSAARLLELCPRRPPVPPPPVLDALRGLSLWAPCRLLGRRLVRRRGRQAGCRHHVCKHSTDFPTTPTRQLSSIISFGCLNICSVASKIDDVLELRRDRSIDVLCLVETWHDVDSVAFRRLRVDGFSVVDRPRPRSAPADRPRPRPALAELSPNHGGVAVVAAPGVHLAIVTTVADVLSSFESLCVRVTHGQFAAIIVVVYRPGSSDIQPVFFTELSSLFDAVAAYKETVLVVGDFNIWFDQPDHPHTRQFIDIVSSCGFGVLPTGPTRGLHTIDAVVMRTDDVQPTVDTIDVGLSDHNLLQWSVPAHRSPPPIDTMMRRPWRQLNADVFREALAASSLCQPDVWPTGVDDLARLYDSELNVLLDRLLPFRLITRRPRPSDPWFDQECRDAKRLTHKRERAYFAACRRAARDSLAAAAKDVWYAQRRSYRTLLEQKRSAFWTSTIEADRHKPQQLWRSVDLLLGRGRQPASAAVSVVEFSRFFADKVDSVRAKTADAPEPTFSSAPSGSSFQEFQPICVGDVISAIGKLPDKSSSADSLPVPVLKLVANELAPFLTALFNCSLAAGHFPEVFKEAFISPILKKPSLDSTDVRSYRPISNLSVISKLLERSVARQLVHYLQSSNLLPALQSGFRAGHSTETAVLRVLSDLLRIVDSGDYAALVLLDLSAAFDTVDHAILLRRLQTSFGLSGPVISWFRSYLTGRSQYVRRGASRSPSTQLKCGVPQGSVLGPILFILYTADIAGLIERFGLHPHLYADDTQIYGSCSKSGVDELQQRLSACTDDVANWMHVNRLQLNTDKTELLWCTTSRQLHHLPTASIRIGPDYISPSANVRDLGIYLDSDLTMRSHVQRTVAACFATLRQLRSVRRSVPPPVYQTLVVALVLSKLDYGNATLIGLPAYLYDRLQSVLNAAARSIAGLRRYDHVTDALASFHWLRVPERVQYKMALLTFRALRGTAPVYLSSDLRRTADIPTRQRLRSAVSGRLDVPSTRLKTVGDRAFSVAGPRLWNKLPDELVNCQLLSTFRRKLKTHFFKQSYPDIIFS